MWEEFAAKLTLKSVGIALGALAVLAVVGFGVYKVKSYVDYVHAVEQANIDLGKDKETLTKQKADLVKDNKANKDVYDAATIQHNQDVGIANQERDDAQARANKKDKVYHAIDTSTSPVQPVSPVITDTLNSLWDTGPSNVAS